MLRISKPNNRVLMVTISEPNNRFLIKGDYIEILLKGDPMSTFYVGLNIGKVIAHKSKTFIHW